MNRRNFLRGLGLTVAAVAMAPAVKLLYEEDTICCNGYIAQIDAEGSYLVYDDHPTMAMFEEVIEALGRRNNRFLKYQ